MIKLSKSKYVLVISLLSTFILFIPFTNCTRRPFTLKQSDASSLLNANAVSSGNLASKIGLAAGMRPLTVREYNASVRAILKDNSDAATAIMPKDTFIPFDNYYEYASVSPAKIEAFEILATDITTAFINDESRLKSVLPCIPTSSTDTSCFTTIIKNLGRVFFGAALFDSMFCRSQSENGKTSLRSSLKSKR